MSKKNSNQRPDQHRADELLDGEAATELDDTQLDNVAGGVSQWGDDWNGDDWDGDTPPNWGP